MWSGKTFLSPSDNSTLLSLCQTALIDPYSKILLFVSLSVFVLFKYIFHQERIRTVLLLTSTCICLSSVLLTPYCSRYCIWQRGIAFKYDRKYEILSIFSLFRCCPTFSKSSDWSCSPVTGPDSLLLQSVCCCTSRLV